MTDHRTVLLLAAAAIDAPLDDTESAELRGHLAACPACREAETRLRADAAAIRRLDFGDAPVSIRARVAEAAAAAVAPAAPLMGSLAMVIGLLLLLAAAVGVLAVGAQLLEVPRTPLLSDRGDRIRWSTDVVDLRAADFAIEVAGRTYTGSGRLSVDSDPGSATYRTLEVQWHEHGTPMRLYLYFGGDDTHWWVDEVRTYDGSAAGEWTVFRGPLFRTPNGQPFSGEVTLTDAAPTPATVRFVALRLATRPSDLVNAPPGGGIRLAENARPFDPGGPLHCSGILQLSPQEAERRLLALGYAVSWRYVTNNYWDPRKEAPDGVIWGDVAVGTSGELIIPVLPMDDPQAVPAPAPFDCPTPSP